MGLVQRKLGSGEILGPRDRLGLGDGSAVVDTGRLCEAHHNPFQYYARWPHYVRAGHMRSSDDFLADARAGRLAGVSFLKAAAARTEHPADSAPRWGMSWVESLVRPVAAGPAWDKTAILITYDEGGVSGIRSLRHSSIATVSAPGHPHFWSAPTPDAASSITRQATPAAF